MELDILRCVFTSLLICQLIDQSVSQTVVTTNVGKIAGFQTQYTIFGKVNIVTKFLGIPYAEDTSGQNRFKKPIPKAPFNATFNASTISIPCMQAPAIGTNNVINMTEDCLTLNIFVPRDLNSNSTTMAKLPVMIWIHGGAFVSGSAKGYDGDALSTVGNVIVVTVNYRLAEFGFLNSGDGRATGNQGLWDQHLAFKWVKNNIASFMGDPNEITIFGESAGGVSVILHSMYVGNKGLFKRVISESGSALAYFSVHDPKNIDILYKAAGCDNSSQGPVDCLRQKSAKDILSLLSRPEIAFRGCCSNNPTFDHDFLVEMPHDIVFGNNSVSSGARQFFRSLDILTGVTNGDGALFFLITWLLQLRQMDLNNFVVKTSDFRDTIAPYYIEAAIHPPDNGSLEALKAAIEYEYIDWSDPDSIDLLRRNLLRISSDIGFFVPVVQTVEAHSASPVGRSYLYVFSAEPPARLVPTPSWFKGANHADDVQYVFGAPFLDYSAFRQTFSFVATTRNGTVTEADKNLALGIMTTWSNFAKSGNPNSPVDVTHLINTTWPEYDPSSQRYLDFTFSMSSASVKQHFGGRAVEFWTKLIPAIVKDTTKGQPVHLTSPVDAIVGK